MSFRVYLVDDEQLALDRMIRLLEAAGGVTVVGSTTDPAAALAFLSTARVDAVFLDIQMPGMNGFELLSRLPEQPAVIFTTAYDQYALQAFAVNSIDYLLKPVDPGELQRALTKLERLRAGARPEWMSQPDLGAFLAKLGASLRPVPPEYPARVASQLGDRTCLIELAEVTHFMAQDKLTYAVTNEKRHTVSYTIAELEKKLDPRQFVRIHRAVLVNLSWVAEVRSHFGGQVTVYLKNDKRSELPVSRDRVRLLRDKLGL
jgi:two-component system, LytTR family, response regulator